MFILYVKIGNLKLKIIKANDCLNDELFDDRNTIIVQDCFIKYVASIGGCNGIEILWIDTRFFYSNGV